jgi:hypothetical protein
MPVLFYVFWIALLTASMTIASDATWKPEYAKNPPAVTARFKEARVPGGCDNSQKAKAWNRLGICGCCEQADRLKTKFVADTEGDWSYYPDPGCTTKGCLLKPIRTILCIKMGSTPLTPTMTGSPSSTKCVSKACCSFIRTSLRVSGHRSNPMADV